MDDRRHLYYQVAKPPRYKYNNNIILGLITIVVNYKIVPYFTFEKQFKGIESEMKVNIVSDSEKIINVLQSTNNIIAKPSVTIMMRHWYPIV